LLKNLTSSPPKVAASTISVVKHMFNHNPKTKTVSKII
jgi:hypothetical protein